MRHLIAQARYRAGYTQTQLARRIGVSPGLVAMIETGERRVTPEIGARIARAVRSPEIATAYCSVCPVGGYRGRCQEERWAA